MAIIFETLDDLKQFLVEFQPKDGSTATSVLASKASRPASPAPSATPSEPDSEETPVKKRRGRPAVAKTEKAKQPTVKKEKKPRTGETLTERIKTMVGGYVERKESFTANDIYDEMSKKDSSVNKQSVITSVLKQMNTNFSQVKTTTRPGKGPRPVKVYLPE